MGRMKNPPPSWPHRPAHLGVQRADLSDVSAGVDGINADLAVWLAMAFGSSAEVWLGMQAEHGLAQVQE